MKHESIMLSLADFAMLRDGIDILSPDSDRETARKHILLAKIERRIARLEKSA